MARRNAATFKRFMRKVLTPVGLAERRTEHRPPSNVDWLPALSPAGMELASDQLLLDMLAVMLEDAGFSRSPPRAIVAQLLLRHARQKG